MAYTHRRRPSLIHDLRETRRRLQDSCSRLDELVRRREEELRFWEEEATRFLEEEAERQRTEQRQAEERQFFEELLSVAQEESMKRHAPGFIAKAWLRYEERWKNLHTVPSSGLTFRTIPWPVAVDVTVPEGLDSHLISQFILSPEHSHTTSRKRRIYAALLRWHTDHFDRRVLHKVVDRDRHAVKEGVGIVVRCLNGLLALERQ